MKAEGERKRGKESEGERVRERGDQEKGRSVCVRKIKLKK